MQVGDFWIDGDKRRIYEAPAGFSFVLDGDGYRIYTPDAPATAPTSLFYSVYELWSRSIDFLYANGWSTIVFDISGGAYRYTDQYDEDKFALIDLRFINDWAYVPADYAHNTYIKGNLFPNAATNLDFDVSRIVSQGVSPRIQYSDAGERSVPLPAGSDVIAPVWDSVVGIVDAYQNNDAINISWGSASDASGVEYKIYISGNEQLLHTSAALFATVNGNAYVIRTEADGVTELVSKLYYIAVTAVDRKDNETSNTNSLSVLFEETSPMTEQTIADAMFDKFATTDVP